MRRFVLAFAVLPALLWACEPEIIDEGKDEPEEPEIVLIDPVALSFAERGRYQITASYQEESGEWLLTTTGTDPYLYTNALEADLKLEHRMLSFEYLCSSGIDDLQVFYGNAITEQRSRHFGTIAPTVGETWKSFSCNIALDRVSFDWGYKGEKLRLDFGSVSNLTIRIKNLRLRSMTESEFALYEEELKKVEGKNYEAARIEEYVGGSYPCSVTSVTIGESEVTVKGTTDGGKNYSLADIAPWDNLTEMSSFPIKTDIKGSSFTLGLPRRQARGSIPSYDRLLSRFVVVNDKNQICSHARYADEVYAESNPAAVSPKSKKGLGGFVRNNNISDLDDLGITSVTVNIVLNSFINTEQRGNYNIAYDFGGITYYMDSGNVSYMDKVLQECYKRGIVVSAIILNRQSDTNSAATPLMKHPENDGGNYSMPNLTKPASVNVYAAVLDFLAKRYSSSSYGRIHHWIMHNEVDFQKEWTNMGDQPEWRYMDAYVKSMRLCHNIAHKYDPNASVLISLTHSWARREGQYASLNLLEDLCGFSAAEGDFLWGVAYHPYPQALAKPEFWKDDSSATYSADSPFCTFKNLEVVSDWMMDREHYYKGSQKRILFLSENGTNSPSYSESDLAKQAAGTAWAWKKVAALAGIDACQWHNWQDNRGEGGLRIGLRRFPDDSEDPNGRKPSWYVWQAAGTASESSVFDKYLPVIGLSSWQEIFGR